MELYLILIAWAIGGFINNLSGMGAGMIAVPIIALILPIEVIIPVSCICGAALGVYLSLLYGRYAKIKTIVPMVIGSIPGNIVGLYVLSIISKDLLQVIIGCLLIAYALWQWFFSVVKKTQEKAIVSGIVGFISGFSNSSTSFGGPPGYAYSVFLGWDRKTAIGTLSLYYLFMSVFTLVGQYNLGLYGEKMVYYTILSLSGMGIGILVSVPFIKRVTPENYKKGILAILIVAGLLSMYEGLF